MPLIVIEGPDFSGKTTLAAALAKTWEKEKNHTSEVVHCGPPEIPNDIDLDSNYRSAFIVKQLQQLLIDSYDNKDPETHLCIFDRFHWGMPIYGQIYRSQHNVDNYGDIGHVGFLMLENEIHWRGGITVHMATPLHILLSRTGRGDDYITSGNEKDVSKVLRDIYFRYIQFAACIGPYLPSFIQVPTYLEDNKHLNTNNFTDKLQLLSDINEYPKSWPYELQLASKYLVRMRQFSTDSMCRELIRVSKNVMMKNIFRNDFTKYKGRFVL